MMDGSRKGISNSVPANEAALQILQSILVATTTTNHNGGRNKKAAGVSGAGNCSICLNTIVDAHFIEGCLHRFCGDCIKEHYQKCSNQCPECQYPISSNQQLIQDLQFSEFVRGCWAPSQINSRPDICYYCFQTVFTYLIHAVISIFQSTLRCKLLSELPIF